CFFFSSRRRHTRSKRDWSSDVCSSDLGTAAKVGQVLHIFTGRLETLMPRRRQRLPNGVTLGRIEAGEQLGPAVLDIELLHDGPLSWICPYSTQTPKSGPEEDVLVRLAGLAPSIYRGEKGTRGYR